MRRLRFESSGAAALGAFLAIVGAANAAPSARLVYLRGPGAAACPGEQVVRAAVSARLGYDPFFNWARDVVFVEIAGSGRGYRIVVKLVDQDNRQRGARKISVPGADCSGAVDAMGLSISLTIDPARAVGGERVPPRPPPPQPESPASATAPSPSPRPAVAVAVAGAPVAPVAPDPSISLRAGLTAVGSLNAAPSTTAGATLFVGVRRRALSLDLEGRADAPATGDSTAPPVQVRSWLVAAALVPCGHLGVAYGCAVVSAGRLAATARNVTSPIDKRGPWSAAGARAGIHWALSPRLALQVYAQVLATLTRNRLLVDSVEVYKVPGWSATAGLGLAWKFH